MCGLFRMRTHIEHIPLKDAYGFLLGQTSECLQRCTTGSGWNCRQCRPYIPQNDWTTSPHTHINTHTYQNLQNHLASCPLPVMCTNHTKIRPVISCKMRLVWCLMYGTRPQWDRQTESEWITEKGSGERDLFFDGGCFSGRGGAGLGWLAIPWGVWRVYVSMTGRLVFREGGRRGCCFVAQAPD